MRADTRLTLTDIEDRMWTKDDPKGGKKPSFDKRALSKRTSLDRCRAGLISWVAKRGREAWTKFMDDLRTPEERANNKVKATDLTSQERYSYALKGVDQTKQSDAPTRPHRIRKIIRLAGEGGTGTRPGKGPVIAEPEDPVDRTSSEDVSSMNVDSDNHEADPKPQPQEQAPGDDSDDNVSLASSIEDPFDSRNLEPTNFEERDSLRRALEVTVEHFFFLTGEYPSPTNPDENYLSQWYNLQVQFWKLWDERSNTAEAPKLRARYRWTEGISQYEFAEVDEGG